MNTQWVIIEKLANFICTTKIHIYTNLIQDNYKNPTKLKIWIYIAYNMKVHLYYYDVKI